MDKSSNGCESWLCFIWWPREGGKSGPTWRPGAVRREKCTYIWCRARDQEKQRRRRWGWWESHLAWPPTPMCRSVWAVSVESHWYQRPPASLGSLSQTNLKVNLIVPSKCYCSKHGHVHPIRVLILSWSATDDLPSCVDVLSFLHRPCIPP